MEHLENIENKGLQLLKKGKKGFFHMVFSRTGVMLILLLLQAGFLFSAFLWFKELLPHILGGSVLLTIIMVLSLLNNQMNPSVKITWLIVIMLMPIFGVLLYWFIQSDIGHRALKDRMNQVLSETKEAINQDRKAADEFKKRKPESAALAGYVRKSDCFPLYQNTDVTYFPSGEAKFEAMLNQLRNAKKFIFLEYFIIDEGIMWGQILEILAQKAKEGVDVRVMYDGTCEFSTLPHNYPNLLRNLGISCKMFAPLTPFISTHYNYRDHRKILVIDGHTAFNGGVNLADEYINAINRFGHWKDTALMLKGEAVKSFTLMFLQMWNLTERTADYSSYLNVPIPMPEKKQKGFVLPYGDSPMDHNLVGERVYMEILNHAREYVHIMTPYLILDGELETALKYAAERGVDVKIILPGVPDKPMAYALAKSHYASLLESGVSIYEYTPGFIHAKVFVSDNCEAVVGTINLDYRSLYHHFECATYLYDVPCISDITADYQKTLQQCRSVTPDTIWHGSKKLRFMSRFLKAIAPLM